MGRWIAQRVSQRSKLATDRFLLKRVPPSSSSSLDARRIFYSVQPIAIQHLPTARASSQPLPKQRRVLRTEFDLAGLRFDLPFGLSSRTHLSATPSSTDPSSPSIAPRFEPSPISIPPADFSLVTASTSISTRSQRPRLPLVLPLSSSGQHVTGASTQSFLPSNCTFSLSSKPHRVSSPSSIPPTPTPTPKSLLQQVSSLDSP